MLEGKFKVCELFKATRIQNISVCDYTNVQNIWLFGFGPTFACDTEGHHDSGLSDRGVRRCSWPWTSYQLMEKAGCTKYSGFLVVLSLCLQNIWIERGARHLLPSDCVRRVKMLHRKVLLGIFRTAYQMFHHLEISCTTWEHWQKLC